MSDGRIDLTDPVAKRMIRLAKKRGYVTQEELNQVVPPDEFSPEQIQDVLEQLSEVGITLVHTVPKVRE